MPWIDNTPSVFWKIQGAVAESDPFVAHMSTLYPASFHIINPYGQRISFSEPVSFELSVNRENGLHFMTFTIYFMKCGAFPLFSIHVVFVVAVEYFCTMFESGNIFGNSRLRWLENASRVWVFAHMVVHRAVMREVVSSRRRLDQHSGSLNTVFTRV